MNVEHIRRRLSGGFEPFALVTSSGDKFVVPHPEFIMLHPRTVVVMDKDGYCMLRFSIRCAWWDCKMFVKSRMAGKNPGVAKSARGNCFCSPPPFFLALSLAGSSLVARECICYRGCGVYRISLR
jgi:hypothetical protein